MKNLTLSQIDLNIEEVNLSEINGGQTEERIFSGTGKNAITGKMTAEFITIMDDDSWFVEYRDIP